LVSISYRELTPREVVDLCIDAELQGIEWGGDIHVPHGDLQIAREVAQMTRDSGLQIAAYGSYYRCGAALEFERVLESAIELGAPLIRVWAGQDGNDFAAVADDLRRICALASAQNIAVATEYHGGTLTETRDSTARLFTELGESGLQTLWQPLRRGAGMNLKIQENLGDLRAVTPFLANVHVYEWRDIEAGKTKRFSLKNSAQWPTYITELQKMEGERWMLIEYVPEDDPKALKAEAQVLRDLIENL
jgi:sugar phosphate isomerase/epimerase